ncbi:tetratricopeptide repeat protein [Cyanobacterium sp. DS4]|uniref:O-linked N-acetylglucosamine transferase, SPINDLY family protein n=1 Tax=Cyanobacterium sp. DS4 TaxID=2878255 RepID=UPI002E80096F|nr:tetratricopeptide repeat protein [Cyanobacterium sp. Dongsha4]WVL02241.1 tetratricopeptide repeat protein [Cyanobacterium sp. Dongsha4]
MNQRFAIKQFLDLENYDNLISFYEKRLEENSENYTDYIYLGLAYVLNGNQIEGETTWFYLLTLENSEYSDLLISVLDQVMVAFVENNQIDFAILVYQNLRAIAPHYKQLQLKCNNLIQQWIEEAIKLTKNSLLNEAKYQYQLIIKFEDNQSYLWQNLSLIHYQLSEYIQAYQAILQGINSDPENYLNFYYGAIFLEKLNNIEDAIKFYQQSIKLNPNHLDSYNNLGNLLLNNNQIKQAGKYYLLAFDVDNQYFGTCLNLGNLYLKDDRITLALDYYNQALKISPTYENFLWIVNNIRSFNYIQESINFARHNCHLLPDDNLFASLEWDTEGVDFASRILPFIYENEEEITFYRQNLTRFLQRISQINLEVKNNRLLALHLINIHTNYHLHYQAQNDLQLQKLYGNFIHEVMKTNYPDYSQPIKINKNREKIRIGYISYCLRTHVVGKLFLGWVKNHNQNKFEIYCYYLRDFPQDKITDEFKQHSDYFYQFKDNISIEKIAKQIKDNDLDILVFLDLSMYSRMSQLAGLKLAPIQCVTWGHPITSGIPTIDYFISSELIEGDNAQNHYSEKLIKLPNLGVVYPQRKLPQVEKNKAKFNLREDKIIYISSQYCSKYLPQYDYIYTEIARQVKNCQFVFIHPRINQNNDKITAQLWARIKRSFSNYQLDWQDYCIFLPTIKNHQDYWQLLNSCDIFLDTIGFTGFNSTLDALESFLPVITYSGDFFRTRQSEGILKMIQVIDTIANSVKDYIKLAIRLGQNDELRNNISDKIRKNIYLLYDDWTAVKGLEKFYLSIK